MNYLEQVPDGVKVTGSLAAPALAFLGISVEDWTYVLSAIVSLMFIIEKLPTIIFRIKTLIRWIDEKRKRNAP